jgi:hypothetical protein
MTLRYSLSRLGRPAARRSFGRAWLVICLVGAAVSLAAFGARHLFFILTVWIVCVFAPVRIAIEALHTIGPRIRRQMEDDLERRDDRYSTREQITMMVDVLYGRTVHMPRLAPPGLSLKVKEAASSIAERAFLSGGGPLTLLRAALICASLLERWMAAIAGGEYVAGTGEPPDVGSGAGDSLNGEAPPVLWNPGASIQEQWGRLRAVAGMAALVRTLAAVYEDSTGRALDEGQALWSATDAAMDYVDQIGLRLEGPPWEYQGGMPQAPLPADVAGRLAGAWTEFCLAPEPAPRRLLAFVESVPE